MSPFFYVALFAWVPVVVVLFGLLPPRRAALMALGIGYLFLPQGHIPVAGMVDVSKSTVIGIGVLLGMFLVDPRSVGTFRLRWFDLPMIVWCLSPMTSSVSNGLGLYDGFSGVIGTVTMYGAPYFVGRVYIRTAADLRALALGIFIGGLIYVPLCLYESRMSPQLHRIVYGFHQHSFAQTKRLGGWRPMVFLEHGLAVGMWMVSAAAIGLWLWRARALGRTFKLKPIAAVALLGLTALLCNSLGAIMLGLLGLTALFAFKWMKSPAPLLLLCLMMPMYLTARIAYDWKVESMVAVVEKISHDRSLSLAGRVQADAKIRDRALQRPWFGWGGYNRFRKGLGPVLPDSLWSIVLGQRGLLGLLSLFGVLAYAPIRALKQSRRAFGPDLGGPDVPVLIVVLALFSLDCMVNAMLCPVYFAVAGALMGWTPPASPRVRRPLAHSIGRGRGGVRTAGPQS